MQTRSGVTDTPPPDRDERDEPEREGLGEPDLAGSEPPSMLPWTVLVPDGGGYRSADLEQPAPLPRVGDLLEYLDEAGDRHWYSVSAVVHTLQSSPNVRPHVDEANPPNTAPHWRDAPEVPGSSGEVRAGLPRVYLAPAPPFAEGADQMTDSDRSRPKDAGAYIGREPELASETIPGGVRPDDERVAAGDTQSSGTGAEEHRVQGRDDEPPGGHRDAGPADEDAAVREAGSNR